MINGVTSKLAQDGNVPAIRTPGPDGITWAAGQYARLANHIEGFRTTENTVKNWRRNSKGIKIRLFAGLGRSVLRTTVPSVPGW